LAETRNRERVDDTICTLANAVDIQRQTGKSIADMLASSLGEALKNCSEIANSESHKITLKLFDPSEEKNED
jgi:hypothetical protein